MLFQHVPARYKLMPLERVFSSSSDGYSLTNFFAHVQEHSPTVLLIRTDTNRLLGAYLSFPWLVRTTCFFFAQTDRERERERERER